MTVSPAGSFKGYDFWTYVSKNADLLKAVGTATVGLSTALFTFFGIGLSPELVGAVSGFAGAIFHVGISALQFKYSEVKL